MKPRRQFVLTAATALACAARGEMATPQTVEGAASGQVASSRSSGGAQPRTMAGTDLADGVRLCTGDFISCIIVDDGSVHCWGPAQPSGAKIVEGVADVRRVVCGYATACAVSGDGTARCWKHDDFAAVVLTHQAVVSVALGEDLLCLSDEKGDVACSWRWSELMPKEKLSDIVEVVAGYYHACALGKNGLVSCWGRDSDFQLGVSNGVSFEHGEVLGEQWVSLLVDARSETADFRDLAEKKALLSREALQCLALARTGEAVSGRITFNATVRKRGSPLRIDPPAESLPALDGSALHECFAPVLRRDFLLPHDEPEPLEVTVFLDAKSRDEANPVVYPVAAGIVELDALGYLTCAISDEGSTWCWGSGAPYGSGETDSIWVPSGPSRIVGLDDAVSVAVGWTNVCILRKDQSVRCFGANPNEVFGVEPDSPHGAVSEIPAFAGYRALDLGPTFGCGIDPDGIVKCFGQNGGHLGATSGEPHVVPPTRVPGLPRLTMARF